MNETTLYIVTYLNVDEPSVAIVGVAQTHDEAVQLLKADVAKEMERSDLDEEFAALPSDEIDHVYAYGGLYKWQIHTWNAQNEED